MRISLPVLAFQRRVVLSALAVRMWWPSGGSVCGYSWQLGVAEGQGYFGAGGGVHAEWVGPVDKLGFPGCVCRVKKWGFCPLDAVGREMGGVLCNV